MPKIHLKKRVSNIQDGNRDPMRKRLSRRKSRNNQHLRSKDKVEKPATGVGENGSPVLAADNSCSGGSSLCGTSCFLSHCWVSSSDQESCGGGKFQRATECRTAPHSAQRWPSSIFRPSSSHTAASQDILTSEEESTPKKVEAGKMESVAEIKAIPQSSENRGVGVGHSASKLKISRASRACRTLLAPQTLHARRGCFLLSSSHSQEPLGMLGQ